MKEYREGVATAIIGAVNLVFTLLAMRQVDKLGHKPLVILGASGLTVLCIFGAVAPQQQSANAARFLRAAIGTNAVSSAPVTRVLISEIFSNRIRGIATLTAVVALWLPYALLVFRFPFLQKMGAYTPFCTHAGIRVFGRLFIPLRVKEPKGKTQERVEASFAAQ